MDIATKAARIKSGGDSQHGVRSAPEKRKVAAIVRLRSLLRGDTQASRAEAAESPYFASSTQAAPHSISPATGPSTEDARSAYESMTVPQLQAEIDDRIENGDQDSPPHRALGPQGRADRPPSRR